MSDPAPIASSTSTPSVARAAAKPATAKDDSVESVFLVAYPKIIFLYPTFFISLLAGVLVHIQSGDPLSRVHAVMGTIFLAVVAVNLVVLAFDFPRTNSLVLFFFCVAVVFALALLFQWRPNLLPFVTGFLAGFDPRANATFYYTIAGILATMFAVVKLTTHFDYWEVRNNELLHHHGLLSDLKRYSSPSLRIDKEISDIFEYCLLGSGRLILQPSGEPRAIILDNVLFINAKEARLTKLLGTLQVEMHQSPGQRGATDQF